MRLPPPPDLSSLGLPAAAREVLENYHAELHAAMSASVVSEFPGFYRQQLPGGTSLRAVAAANGHSSRRGRFSRVIRFPENVKLILAGPLQRYLLVNLTDQTAESFTVEPDPCPAFCQIYDLLQTYGDIVIPRG